MLLRRARTAATTGGPTPVPHTKMHPPKQPIEPETSVVARTRPVFLGFAHNVKQSLPTLSRTQWHLERRELKKKAFTRLIHHPIPRCARDESVLQENAQSSLIEGPTLTICPFIPHVYSITFTLLHFFLFGHHAAVDRTQQVRLPKLPTLAKGVTFLRYSCMWCFEWFVVFVSRF